LVSGQNQKAEPTGCSKKRKKDDTWSPQVDQKGEGKKKIPRLLIFTREFSRKEKGGWRGEKRRVKAQKCLETFSKRT